MLDFDSVEEYEKFAAKRNEATKRCRQKKDGELKVPIQNQSQSQLLLAQNPLQCYRTEHPKLKATIHKQSKTIANLEARVAHLERDLATAIKKLAIVEDDGCSTKTKDKKENGKLQK